MQTFEVKKVLAGSTPLIFTVRVGFWHFACLSPQRLAPLVHSCRPRGEYGLEDSKPRHARMNRKNSPIVAAQCRNSVNRLVKTCIPGLIKDTTTGAYMMTPDSTTAQMVRLNITVTMDDGRMVFRRRE